MSSVHLMDFSGHPFQVELSRGLAERGYRVTHAFSTQYGSGKGDLEHRASDPPTLRFAPITTGAPFEKYSARKRAAFERSFAREWFQRIKSESPDVVIACNVPLLALSRVSRWVHQKRIPMVIWHQDVFSSAMGDELRRRLPAPVASIGTTYLTKLEQNVLKSAAQVVAIGDEFTRVYTSWGIDLSKVTILPNWAPLDDISPVDRENDWVVQMRIKPAELRIVYAGTLGRKHNPDLLIDLLRAVRASGLDARLVVVSEGESAEEIASSTENASCIQVLPFQPMSRFREVLGSADVLVALLEPEASRFSIPSKVLSYLAAGRAVVGLMPAGNPAAADIRASGGTSAEPTAEGARRVAEWIVNCCSHPGRLREIGAQSRAHAEASFSLPNAVTTFERVLRDSVAS